ncbi:MAG: RagB/SusD family nutrient uptake outer membrane protein [Bacteroidales bacterium]
MKKIIFILLLGAFISCESILDKSPLDSISSGTFWKSEDDLRLFTNNMYSFLSLSSTIDNWSSDYFQRGTNSISSGNNVPSNSDGTWNDSYKGIRRANEFLENVDNAEVPESVKDRYSGEIKFFRAYLYFKLVQRFGDVPLVLNTIDFDSPDLFGDRTPRVQVVNQIISDLQSAADVLPKKSELVKTDKGRVTRGTALGFLSRVALFEGTYEKYHKIGNSSSRLQIAKQAAFDFINENEYPLVLDFSTLYSEDNENNSETALAKWYKESVTGVSPLGRNLMLEASIAPTKKLADAFLCIDGLPIQFSPLFKGYNSLNSEFVDRDPRMAFTIWEPGTDFGGNPLVPELRMTSTGYWPKKPGDPKALSVTFVYTDQILLRTGEVLLNYAEAVYELDGAISDTDLNLSINKLRTRAHMPKLTNAFVNGSNSANKKLDMLEELRRERRIELAGEGFRYYDLIRWKTAETDLPIAILGAKFQKDYYPEIVPGVDIFIDENGFIIAQGVENRQFISPKNYLFPVPLGQIALNSSLEQNPGWD